MNTRHLRPEDLRGKRYRGWVRESTQAQAEMWSPERQRADIVRAAAELGLIAVEPPFYERTGSGEVEAAPELAQAVRDGRAGEYDVLVVLHTSRFARNRAEAVRMKAEFAKAGVVIYFAAQRLISGTYAGALTEGVNEVIDAVENETRRLWIAGGQRQRQLSGRWTGGVPYGYARVMADFPDGTRRWDGGLEADPDTAPVVRRIFDEILAGAYARSVAVGLNADGIRSAMGGAWTRAAVTAVVRNPAYEGRMERYRLTNHPHYYPEDDPADGRRTLAHRVTALVVPEVAQSARALIAGRRRSTGREPAGDAYPMSGIARCGDCGYPMTGSHNSRGSRYYRCSKRTTTGACEAPYVNADTVERQFADWVSAFRLPADWRHEIALLTASQSRQVAVDRRTTLEGQMARLKNLYVLGDIPEDDYRTRMTALRTDLATLAPPSIANIGQVADAISDIGRAWTKDTDPRRAAIPRLLLEAATVRGGGVKEWVVRAEMRPLVELGLGLAGAGGLYSLVAEATVRYA